MDDFVPDAKITAGIKSDNAAIIFFMMSILVFRATLYQNYMRKSVFVNTLEYPQFIGVNFILYLISLCGTDVLSSENLEKQFLVCTTVITIILSLLIPAVTFHIAADVAATVLSF